MPQESQTGADPGARNRYAMTALLYAAVYGYGGFCGAMVKADAHYRRAIELWLGSVALRPARLAGAQNNLAELHLQRGDSAAALRCRAFD